MKNIKNSMTKKVKLALEVYNALTPVEKMDFAKEIYFFGQTGISKQERLRLIYLLMYLVEGIRAKQKSKITAKAVIISLVGKERYTPGTAIMYDNLAELIEMMLFGEMENSTLPIERGLTSETAIKESKTLLENLLPF